MLTANVDVSDGLVNGARGEVVHVLGPHFTLSSTAEARYLHSLVTKTMLVFHQYGFHIRCL